MTKTLTKATQNQRKGSFRAGWSRFAASLGRVGKALLFPIATLPIAAIFLRVGTQIPNVSELGKFVSTIFTAAGNTVFSNLHILFAIGVAFGLAKDNRGEAGLSAFIGLTLVTMLLGSSTGAADLPNQIYGHTSIDFHKIFGNKYNAVLAQNVLNGFISGAVVAWIYNKWNGTELPSVLGFFSGRRLIPVLSVVIILFLGIIWAIVFPWFGWVLYKFSNALGEATHNTYGRAGIMFIYGIINRLLLPFGMHHIPNTYFWFQWGSALNANGQQVHGDINIFLQGVAKGNDAGTFQSGFFPIMMFGLPALAALFYHLAESKEQKQRVLALFGSAALVSFLTGITEPIEFAFIFIAPGLYAMHALLTGVFGFITGLFGIQLGFGFSAGLFDYLLSIPKSLDIIHANKTGIQAVMANPAWIWAIGAVAAGTYFFLGKFLVKKFNLSTPGRGENVIMDDQAEQQAAAALPAGSMSLKARRIVQALGGWGNITNYQNCATRLRYDVKDADLVDDQAVKKAGAIAVMKVSKTHVQVIIGPTVEILNNEIIAHKGEKLTT